MIMMGNNFLKNLNSTLQFVLKKRLKKIEKAKNSYQIDLTASVIIFKAAFLFLFFQGFMSESFACEDGFLSSKKKAVERKKEVSVDEFVYTPPVNPNNIRAIRNGLKLRKDTPGGITVAIEQPFSLKIAEKLRKFLSNDDKSFRKPKHMEGGSSMLVERGQGIDPVWKEVLLELKALSPAEIDKVEKGFDRYFETIEQIILKMDKTFVIGAAYVSSERQLGFLVQEGHRHFLDDAGWITATHAILGDGTWFEVIHNRKQKRARAKNGETLLFSEIRRVFALSGGKKRLRQGALHGASPGKRLVIVADFNLTSEARDMLYLEDLLFDLEASSD